jgi:hypothetical protein
LILIVIGLFLRKTENTFTISSNTSTGIDCISIALKFAKTKIIPPPTLTSLNYWKIPGIKFLSLRYLAEVYRERVLEETA